jgi:ribosomal protein S18 acetylase RimI-like enzyme
VDEIRCRRAGPHDAEGLARLHADSWRDDYRGIYSDAFLDGDLLGDRLAVWRERLAESHPDRFTLVAESEDGIVGFIHVILDADPTCGAVVQNLHVAHDCLRRGIGSALVSEGAAAVRERRPSSGVYVWVREDNPRARAFYEAVGGVSAGQERGGPFPDGSRATVLRYVWPA